MSLFSNEGNSLDILNNISLSLFLFLSTRRNEKNRERERGLDEKSILSISLDNFVTPVENGVVISQRIAHSFNIVSSIVSERSLEKAGHFFSFTRRGEERRGGSHVSFPPPTTFIPLRRSTQERGKEEGEITLHPEKERRGGGRSCAGRCRGKTGTNPH